MLTRRGLTTVTLGAGTVVAGRILGMIELFVLGSVAVAVALMALAQVRLWRVRLAVARRVVPERVHAGEVARVELRAENAGRRTTPMLELHDPVGGTRGAQVSVAPMRRGARAQAAYRLPTNGRGVVTVGPLTVTAGDLLGLARTRRIGAGEMDLVVLPRVHPIDLGGHDGAFRRSGQGSAFAFGPTGEEFSALRPYVPGDDLRRVHWLASARHDDLIVRQDQPPRDAELVVVFDRRAATHTEASFETAVSVVASMVAASAGHRGRVVLCDTDGVVTEIANDEHRHATLNALAIVEAMAGGSLRRTLADVEGRKTRGSMVVVLGHASATDMEALATIAPRFGEMTVVVTRPELATATARAGIAVVPVANDADLPLRWAARGTRPMTGASR